MAHQSPCARTTGARKTSYPIHEYIRWVNGVCARTTWRVWEKGTGCLLLEQEVHGMRDELLFARKEVLCLGVGALPFEAVHAELHHLVGIQNGSSQVHLWKACPHWTDRLVVGSVVGVWYCLCHSEGDKGESLGRLPGSITHHWLSAYASRIP